MGGMGTGVAIVGAYVLAGELALAGGDHRKAFAAYEARIADFAKGCQKTSGNAGPFFAPTTERRIRSRDRMYRLPASHSLGSRPPRGLPQAAHREVGGQHQAAGVPRRVWDQAWSTG